MVSPNFPDFIESRMKSKTFHTLYNEKKREISNLPYLSMTLH